ncbi:hypothetical protein E6C27_scaffold827G00770 [Cucumis melo var. makuwa]|uniref:Mucin-19-like n=1 Tax=Cucumis melo var. makuwa TaxID=1194695 RepID=A0A5A7VA29_CUCMM|nr:hypothetical protein E6C27_scaffold827G00770 [Cucumis melo var. makuwa]
MYRRVLLMALRYECLRSSMYRLTTPILYAISGLVHVRYRILLQTSPRATPPAIPSSSSSYIVRQSPSPSFLLHSCLHLRPRVLDCLHEANATPFFFFFSSASSLDERSHHPRVCVVCSLRSRTSPTESPNQRSSICSRHLSLSPSLPPPAASPSSSRVPDTDRTPRGAAFYRRRCRKEKGVDPLRVDSIGGHNQVSGKGFPTTGPRIDAGNVVIHKGLHVTRPLVVACVPSGVRSCLRIDTDAGCSVRGSLLSGLWSWSLVVEGRSTRLICASFGSTRLIRASLGISRLIGVSFGITRLIRASFGITRLICAFYGTTRLLCRVRVQRGVDRRGARRMREGHMDASGSLCFR